VAPFDGEGLVGTPGRLAEAVVVKDQIGDEVGPELFLATARQK
jgi:hypothetical protein